MKFINKYKSNNFDNRRSKKVNYIIIHYTALNSHIEAIDFLCEPSNQVSCHYVISKNGKIYNLVNEKKRAWHAGACYWKANKDINSCSIGIELDYNPETDKFFKKQLITSLINLIRILKTKYKIPNQNILGHSDVAPYRKIDPGYSFPWYKLSKANLSILLKPINKSNKIELKKWFDKIKIYSNKDKILFMLSYIGYETLPSIKDNKKYKQLINAYNSHYLRKKHKISEKEQYEIIAKHFINQVLTY